MKNNGYISLWKTTISDILSWINRNNDNPNSDVVAELIQILPRGHVTEGWIGIVRITKPPQKYGHKSGAELFEF